MGVSGLGPEAQVVAASGGAHHTLAVRSDGEVLAWGWNYWGQLGNGEMRVDRSPPGAVTGLGSGSGVVEVAAGSLHSLGLRSNGEVLAWGADDRGQLGNGAPFLEQAIPVPVSGLGAGSGVVAVAAGGHHNLALRADGTVLAWGSNDDGKLGNGTMSGQEPSPVAVHGLGPGSGVVAISAGENHGLALRSNGTVVAWGSDLRGQLGDGDGDGDGGGGSAAGSGIPVEVMGLGPTSGVGSSRGVVEIAAGGQHNLARRSDGSVVAWGATVYGQLGNDYAPSGGGPVPVNGLGPGSGVVDLAAGREHSLALRSDGSVLAWGWDQMGQLGEVGDPPNANRASPVPVSGLGAGSGVTALDAGHYFSLALFSGEQGHSLVAADGGVFSFGTAGFFGSLGGIRLNQPVVGMDHTAAARGYWLVASDGGIFSFGDAMFFGSLGGVALNKPIVGMERTPSGHGYWLVASDGGVFAFGDARFLGSTGGLPLNKPIVGMERTPTGDGYWLVASDGGIFAFGAAAFLGSTGGTPTSQPVVAMARTSSGLGYYLLGDVGKVVTFGDAVIRGVEPPVSPTNPPMPSAPSVTALPDALATPPPSSTAGPFVGIMLTPDGAGYWLCTRGGGVEAWGNARDYGSLQHVSIGRPVVGCHAPLSWSG